MLTPQASLAVSRSRLPLPRLARACAVILAFPLALAACASAPPLEPPPPLPPPAAPASPPPAAAVASASTAPADPPPAAPKPVLRAIDVYGTERFDAAWIKTRFGDRIQRWFDIEDEAEADRQRKEIEDAILAEQPELGMVKVSPIVYFNKDSQDGYVTVDIVEKKDMKARTTFGPAPTGDVEDPEGLLAAWQDYESTFFRLLREGKIGSQRVACPAFHCMGGYEHEAFRAHGEKFVKLVPPNEAKLVRVLREDKDPKDRGAAAYLLAHIKDGKKLVDLIMPALRDPDTLVRNNATRVLGNVAMFHHDIPVPLKPILAMLDGPTVTDRNKAVAVLSGLVERPGSEKIHAQVVKEGGQILLRLLRLEQPNNHDFAYKILKKVSGQELGERDLEGWKKWLEGQRKR